MRSVSFSYPQADETIRAELAQRLKRDSLKGFVLSTCLRIEIIVEGNDLDLIEASASAFGGAVDIASGHIRSDEEAVTHLFRVAAGLESPLVGETEILTQYRQALKAGIAAGHMSGLFERLLTDAISAAKQARDLLPGSPYDSLAAMAAQAVGGSESVAVFGAGVMSRAVVSALQSLPAPPVITIVSRSPEKVTVREIDIWPFSRAQEALEMFPAVVSATSAKKRPIPDRTFASALAKRKAPLLVVDMAMPPDFRQSKSPNVRYLNIDDLARMAERRPRSDLADEYVATAAHDAYQRYSRHGQVGPVIAGLINRADEVVEYTVRRFAGRLSDSRDEDVLRQATHAVARSLLAQPVQMAKSGDTSQLDEIAAAFQVDRG